MSTKPRDVSVAVWDDQHGSLGVLVRFSIPGELAKESIGIKQLDGDPCPEVLRTSEKSRQKMEQAIQRAVAQLNLEGG